MVAAAGGVQEATTKRQFDDMTAGFATLTRSRQSRARLAIAEAVASNCNLTLHKQMPLPGTPACAHLSASCASNTTRPRRYLLQLYMS